MSTSRRLRACWLIGASLGIATLTATAMLFVQIPSRFRARRFCAEVLGSTAAKTILAAAGIRCVVSGSLPPPERQVIYLCNHTSQIDLFVLLALGLPRTRFFLKQAAWIFLPVGIVAWMIGTFFTVPQRFPEKRVRIFQRAERVLRHTGESVYLSPEGTRITTGKIGDFNKGAFHLATVLQAPIVPLFIEIPQEIDPGRGYGALPGTVRVHVMEVIDTTDWRLEDLVANREAVRERYVAFNARIRGERQPEAPKPAS